MPHSPTNFRNIILCEDIRNETGNKQSLMGIFSGDIIVAALPATIQMAVFIQYFAAPNDTGKIDIEFRLLQSDLEMIKGKMTADVTESKVVTFVLPRALVTFEKEAIFSLRVKLNEGDEQEILNKKVIKGVTA